MDIFLSYPSERLDVARSVYEFLRSLDVGVWFDKESLVPGQDWDRERADAQSRADLTVLICSPETFERGGVIQREVKNILDLLRDKPFGKIYLISLRTEEFGFPPELARYQWIDYFEPKWAVHLARSVKHKYTESAITPPEKLTSFLEGKQQPDVVAKSFVTNTDVLEADARFIQYNLSGDYWNYVNSEIISIVYGSYYSFKRNNQDLFLPTHKNEWRISVTEFFRSNEIISLLVFTFGFASGGAHPGYHYTTLNFGGPEVGRFGIQEFLRDMFVEDDNTLEFLRHYCELEIKKQLLSIDREIDEFWWPDKDEKTWKTKQETWGKFEQFSFDKTGLTINFSPYDLLAYAFGSFVIHIPWSMIRSKIRPKFATWFVPEVIEGKTD
jgi:hypothetical protein